jgi:hypothetical protein
VRREPHPAAPGLPLGGGPQMVEISRDGRRIYVTNPLYAAWDEVFIPTASGHGWRSLTPTSPPAVLSPTSNSSRTATTFVAAGFTKPGSKAVTLPVTRTASPADWQCR